MQFYFFLNVKKKRTKPREVTWAEFIYPIFLHISRELLFAIQVPVVSFVVRVATRGF